MADTIDWDDPCAALAALRAAQRTLALGGAVAEVTHRGKTVKYAKSDGPGLGRETARLEGECAASIGQTVRPVRFAIRAGGVR